MKKRKAEPIDAIIKNNAHLLEKMPGLSKWNTLEDRLKKRESTRLC